MPSLSAISLSNLSRNGASADTAGNRAIVVQVRRRVEQLQKASTDCLQELTLQLKRRVKASCMQRDRTFRSRLIRSGNRDAVEAHSLITEAVRRSLGKSYYDVQLLAGIELTRGRIVQMQTGEGKTITTALPAFRHALTGRGVHIATTNAYLAGRDFEELRPAFELLGMTVGLLPEEHVDEEKRRAYQCDLTFGTGFDFGFDFLRDQLSIRNRPQMPLGQEHVAKLLGYRRSVRKPLQRPHAFTVVDEADGVLVDEATMPLILSSSAGNEATPEVYALARQVADELRVDDDYTLDSTDKRLALTEEGWVESHASLNDRRLPLARPWSKYVLNALRAKLLLERDVDYVVLNGKVQIIDQHTGRIHPERSWRDGLHQAIETKEATEVTAESASDARVTRQRYFQLYDTIAGMTGTAIGVEQELKSFYGLMTVVIPTHRPCLRNTQKLRSFREDSCRNEAIVRETVEMNQQGRPVLVGTRTIRHSLRLSERLRESGLPHRVLNGVQDEEEASIVAQAGHFQAVTIATNMAGRGTDIRLEPASHKAGGLHVIGAEHNLSSRVDRQLAGRAARQGNPGSCRFFAAADDEIFAHDTQLAETIRARADGSGEFHQDLAHEVAAIQSQAELKHFEQRRQMVARDYWLDEILKTLTGVS